MGAQLTLVASIYCLVGFTNANGRSISALRHFVQLDLGLQIFLVYSIVITTFSLFPSAWSTIVPARFWEVSCKIAKFTLLYSSSPILCIIYCDHIGTSSRLERRARSWECYGCYVGISNS